MRSLLQRVQAKLVQKAVRIGSVCVIEGFEFAGWFVPVGCGCSAG